MIKAGGKTLTINGSIEVDQNLSLSGKGTTQLLKIDSPGLGTGTIHLTSNNTTSGEFLDVPITSLGPAEAKVYISGTDYTVTKSSASSLSMSPVGTIKGWKFEGATPTETTWTGGLDQNWNAAMNWNPIVPNENTTAIIPAGLSKYPNLNSTLTPSDAKAKKVIIQAASSTSADDAGLLDLADQVITTTGGKKAEIRVEGKLKLTGTSGKLTEASDQKAWFSETNYKNRIHLSNTSTVIYYNNDDATIWNGAYYNLRIEDEKTINADSELTVNGNFTNAGNGLKKLMQNMTLKGSFICESTSSAFDVNDGNTITLTSGESHKIEAWNTQFYNLTYQNAGGEELYLKNSIGIKGELKLSGGLSNKLTITGEHTTPGKLAAFVLDHMPATSTKGKFLKIHTDKIEIFNGVSGNPTYTVTKSENTNGPSTGTINGWIFEGGTPTDTKATWNGSNSNNWKDSANWTWDGSPTVEGWPNERTEVTIPVVTAGKYPDLAGTTDVKAKTVNVDEDATLTLADQVITTTSGKKAKVTVEGTLRLYGTNTQKAWFGSGANKINLDTDKSTVEYYGPILGTIWTGTYYNLIIANSKTASTDTSGTLKIKGDFENSGETTAKADIELTGDFKNNDAFKTDDGKTFTLTSSENHSIIGSSIQFSILSMENALGKTLTIEGLIHVDKEMRLSGKKSTKKLKINGASGAGITLAYAPNPTTNYGEFLKIYTDNVGVYGNPYTVKKSENANGPSTGTINGWIFDGGTPTHTKATWKGSNNNWKDPSNWDWVGPSTGTGYPNEKTEATIPEVTTGNYPNLTGTADAKAESVILNYGATLNLADQLITDGPNTDDTIKITTKGTLKLIGTSDQKSWFETMTSNNAIVLDPVSPTKLPKVVYMSGPSSEEEIWKGPYYHLTIESGRTVNISKYTVIKGNFENKGTTTANEDIKLTGDFTNSGSFNTANGKTFTLTSSEDHIITGMVNPSDTQFSELTMTGAGSKTLTINKNIQIDQKLILSGTSSNNLEINGSSGSKIDLNYAPDSSNFGKYLNIQTANIGVTTNNYPVKNSLDNGTIASGVKNGWDFGTPIITGVEIKRSLIKADTRDLYVILNKDIPASTFNTTDTKLIISLTATDFTSVTKINSTTWKFVLQNPVPVGNIINSTSNIKIKYGPTPAESTNTKPHISDIGLGVIKVLKATSTRNILNFDGSQIMPKLTTTIITEKEPDNFKMYFSSDNYSSFWTPSGVSAPDVSTNSSTTELTGTDDGTKKKFEIPENDPNFKKKCGFMFVYGGWLPCARLKDSSNPLSYDLWKFNLEGVSVQRGGVSIFNNVVNVSKNEKTSVEIQLKQNGIVTIQIMTLDGSIVKTIDRSNKNAGVHLYHWNGTNRAGEKVARGMYFVRIAGPGIDEIRKVMIIK